MLFALLAAYAIQQERTEDSFPYEAPFSGMVTFSDRAVIDGDSLRGFASLEDGRRVYASYRLGSPEEKRFVEERLCCYAFRAAGTFALPELPPHPYAFDMAAYLKQNGASHVLELDSVDYAVRRNGIGAALSRQRQNVKKHITGTFPEPLRSEALALLIGDRTLMEREEEMAFRTLGISHLYAISGLHIAILTGLLYWLMIRCGIRKESAWLLLALILPAYAVIAGGSPSVTRAVTMAEAVLFLQLFGKRVSVGSVFFASFIAAVLLDPYAMNQIGFQLSYGAVLSLICSARLIGGLPKWKAALCITAITQTALFPLLLLHFYEVSISSFAVNLLFVPLYTAFIVPAYFLFLALTYGLQPAADLLFTLFVPIRELIGSFTETIAGIPHQLWNPGRPSAGWMAALLGSVLLFFISAERGFRRRQLLILLLPAGIFSALPYMDDSLQVSFIDVGQGDSALIELPHQQGTYLIDAGGTVQFGGEPFQERRKPFEVGRQIVIPYLKGQGISKLDALILTHADADHAEGADEVLESVRAEQIHLSPGSRAEAEMAEVLTAAEEAEILEMGEGVSWTAGDVHFRYLAPADSEYAGNDDSLVLLVEQGGSGFLFTGDIEAAGEEALVRKYGSILKRTDVLKIAHHGSKTSSSEAFLEAAGPQLAIISAGKNNRYGHPHAEVTSRLHEFGIDFRTTAECGTVELVYRNGSAEKLECKKSAGP